MFMNRRIRCSVSAKDDLDYHLLKVLSYFKGISTTFEKCVFGK